MKIAKAFLRNGQLMQPGDPVPDDLDAETIRHYRRHGMVTDEEETDLQPRQSAPPPSRSNSTARKPRVPSPTNTQALAPQQASTALPTEGQGAGPLNAAVPALTDGVSPSGSQDGPAAALPPVDAQAGDVNPPAPPTTGDQPPPAAGDQSPPP